MIIMLLLSIHKFVFFTMVHTKGPTPTDNQNNK